MHLLLARHGDSPLKPGDDPSVDRPLTALGREQAHRLGAWLAVHETVDGFYASPLKRAQETAEIVNEYLRLQVRYLEDLREAGEYPLPHVPRQRDPFVPQMIDPPDDFYRAFRQRIERATAQLLGAHPGQTVLIVAHGGTFGTMLRLLLGTPTSLISTDHCGLHKLRWLPLGTDDAGGGHWILDYLNRRAHLEGLEK